MTKWQFDDGPINIGIDIGWSNRKRSCALAIEGLSTRDKSSCWRTYVGDGRPVAVGLFRYTELTNELAGMIRSLGSRRNHTTVVLDGPIGATGLATTNRKVDNEFGRGSFYGRMQPSPVESGLGPRYAGVTEALVQAMYTAAETAYQPAWWDGLPLRGFTCCETHPTVGLALLLPPQHPASLPSRRLPRRMAADGPFVRAKSDWYWQLGAANWVAETLLCPGLAEEKHHERVAGLYCLAVANRLAGYRSEAPTCAAIGDAQGVYVVPSTVHSEWKAALEDIGVHLGQLSACDQSRYLVGDQGGEAAAHPGEHVSIDDSDDAERGDSVTLLLTDNGGIWEKHNDWLTGLAAPVCLASNDELNESIRLRQARRPRMWSSTNDEGAQTPLDLASRRGFVGDYLTLAAPWPIIATLEDCED